MANPNEKDDILFEQLNRNKKRRRIRTILTVAICVALVLAAVAFAVIQLRSRVRERVNSQAAEVKSYQAKLGRINTTVSGTGTLENVDAEEISVPAGVEIDEVLVSAGDTLKKGDAVASVKSSSVMTALASAQESLKSLDDQISAAKNDTTASYISSGVSGRVKRIYAQKDDNVVDVMTEHGALAIISLDGLMRVTIDAALRPQSTVNVVDSLGRSYTGTVELSAGGKSSVTLTDDGPVLGDMVSVYEGEAEVGTGTLELHNSLAVTGFAGTISNVNVREEQQVWPGSSLFSLTNTGYSANYDALLQTRADTEKTINTLIGLLRTGTLCAPFDGTVSSIDYDEEAEGVYSVGAAELPILTMAPDRQIAVNVGIDETDILSLKLGQTAQVTVSSVADDPFTGTVTEITKVGVSSSGVTQYSCIVTMDKDPKMLSGMSATVDIEIQGMDNVVLIPVEALHTTRNRSFVYTSYDPATQEYGGMVEVIPGNSNSSSVEIVSGLKEGDTVYYTERTRNNAFGMFPGMGGMNGNRNNRNNGYGSNRNNGGSNRNSGQGGPGGAPGGYRPGNGG